VTLCVLVACHDLVCAIDAATTERLVLGDEVTRRPGGALVESHGRVYVGWDLGGLLELPPTTAAWVLLHIPHRDRVLPFALRTGGCLAVRTLATTTGVPPRLFQRRPGAFARMFATEAVLASRAPVGFLLDLRATWTRDELDAAARALDRAEAA
jgi:hypothetical protein